MRNLLHSIRTASQYLRIGDWLVALVGVALVIWLFQALWHSEHAAKVQIRLGDKIYGTYSLNQKRDIHVHGPIGEAIIQIANGRARFALSPCTNQYCIHQGWLNHAGQAAICLPNQISLELLGENKPYDSLNY